MTDKTKYIKKYFRFGGKTVLGNKEVFCPFHEDDNPSGSIHFGKGLFNCHSTGCVGGLNFDQLYNKLKEMNENKIKKKKLNKKFVSKLKNADLDLGDVKKKGLAYLKKRKINPNKIPINYHIVDDKEKFPSHYGYIVFEGINDTFVARNITNNGPKSILPPGEKIDLFWLNKDTSNKVVILVEGIFDGLTLHELGFKNVVVCNGSTWPNKESTRKKWAYSFRGHTVLICFDNDPAGFEGSRDIQSILKEFEVDTAIIEMPNTLGNDLNEAWINHTDKLKRWASVLRDRYIPNDTYYVHDLFKENILPAINVLPTGIEALDRKLTGGFKDGNHIISGDTGVGKTSLITFLAIKAAIDGKRSLVNSCEISKRQSWARIAAHFSDYTWSELEENPRLLEASAYQEIEQVSKNITIVNGWPLNRIIQESTDYDIIFIDYIQRVREVYGADDSAHRFLINNYTSKLSDLGALNGKVIITISSLSRDAYGDPRKFGLKESGNLEYTGTTVSRLAPVGSSSNRNSFQWVIQKNNRGDTGVIRITNVDLGHSDFSNAKSKEEIL